MTRAGQTFDSEVMRWADPHTGVEVRQLTHHKGHSHHLYFTNPGWYDGGRRLVFGSDRGNRTNLFGVELATGRITQITDKDMPGPPDETSFVFACVNPTRDEAYFWRGHDLVAVDLHRCEERIIYRAPEGFDVNMLNCTADGQHVCTGIYEKLQGEAVSLLRGYVGFRAYFKARPLSRILRIAVDGSGAEVVFEDRAWIGHVNTSPRHAHLLTFCHEGPWHEVDQRIWGLDLSTGKVWKIRPQQPGDAIGHEYWMADGETIGYHGHLASGEKVYGSIRYDNTLAIEAPFPHDSHHFHSLSLDLIVGDGHSGFPYILLWRYRDGAFEGPRVLCRHRGSAHIQQTHVHPRLSPDGRHIVYTSDDTGYGNVHMAALAAFDSLPTLEAVEAARAKRG